MSRLCRHLVLSSLLVLAFAVPALAQPEQGDKEILLNGDVTTAFGGDAESASTTGNIAAGLGYYFTQRVQLFGALNVSISNDAISGTSADAGIGLSFRYNFAEAERKMVPYLGIEYSLYSFKDPGDSSFIQPNAGLKYYLRRNVAIDFNVSYGHSLSSAGGSVIRESVGLVFGF